MGTLTPIFINSLIGALVAKFLLLCVKRNGSVIGLILAWFFAGLAAKYTPYPFLGALIFGLLFLKVTNVVKIWPYGILAIFLFWGFQHWLDTAMPELLRSSQQELWHRFHRLTNSVNVLYSNKVNM